MEQIIQKMYDGENLTTKEVEQLVWDAPRYDEQEGDSGRWTQRVSTIINPREDDLWRIDWQRGLTEYQENEYDFQPYRVKCVEQTVVIKQYIPVHE